MIARGARRYLAGLPNPTDAALWLRDESGLSHEDAIELLTEHVASHLRKLTSRNTAAAQSNALFGWYKAVQHGTFQWDRAETLGGLLASILRTARREDRDQTYRQYERNISHHLDDADAAETVALHTRDMLEPHQRLCEMHADVIEAQTVAAQNRDANAAPTLAKRAAIADIMFRDVPLAKFSESQARRARARAKTNNPVTVAAAALAGTGDLALAGDMFPFLLGLSARHTRQALQVIADWSAERAETAMRALLHHDTFRHGPRAGCYGDHIVPASLAPKNAALAVA